MVAACAETELVAHTAKQVQQSTAPETQGIYKIGTPYTINGIRYVPEVDYAYTEVGTASWYGPNFHGKPTANGERFDMNALTAAHRTLPMPSAVRVTNLENGRALVLRVNDRGPFAKNRIIDVSRRGAQLLGFQRQGTARVRVDILPGESKRLAALARGEKAPPPIQTAKAENVRAIDASVGGTEQVNGKTTLAPKVFVQAASFADKANAERSRELLARHASASIQEVYLGRKTYYRVRLGPLTDKTAANRLAGELSTSGYPSARVVIE